MGGYGSGVGIRPNASRTKAFIEQYRALDAKEFPSKFMQTIPDQGWQANVFGIPLRVLKDRLEIHQGYDEAHSYFKILFSFTRGNYGNSRYWLTCPNPVCQKRCRKLFLVKDVHGVPIFICRHCLNLAHKSQNKSFLDRLIDKKWKLIRRLGGQSSDMINKPKGMHWKTFERLKKEIENLDHQITYGIASRFGMV